MYLEKPMLKKFKFSILRPGGNDTAIIDGYVPKRLRKTLNDKIIDKFSNVEQCGFFIIEKNNLVNFKMMGGEFSGNAILAITYLVLKGKKGSLLVNSSGTNRVLKTGINNKIVYADIPIFNSFKSAKQIAGNTYLVKLQGISHLVVFKKVNAKNVLDSAKKTLTDFNLLDELCVGCIFVNRRLNKSIMIDPVVWIRDVKTLTYETACGSGTLAVGLALLKSSKINQIKLDIKQPSGNLITVNVSKNKKEFTQALIESKVTTLISNETIILQV